jgi:small subunit ribosomal protein S18
MLRRFVNDRGKILPRRITGNCAVHQRELTTAVKRSRIMAILSFASESYR